MDKSIQETIESFIKYQDKPNHRFNSWRHCYRYFQDKYLLSQGDDESASLHLGFYLASWGMYRGSSFLLQNDYTIHQGVVKLLKEHHHQNSTIEELKEAITTHYQNNAIPNGKGNSVASDTLISKILLGTFANTPAYDRFLIEGIKIQKQKGDKLTSKFNAQGLEALERFYESNRDAFEPFETHYPKMKLIDMYFWKLGFDKMNQSNI